MSERLQKYMARCGVASRRNCEKIINQGRVAIDGKVVTEMGIRVNPKIHEVKVDGRIIRPESDKIYIILNKPSGYITSLKDPQGRRTVMDLIGNIESRIYPVGRLDYESEGLLMLTNDGELTYALTHPRYEIQKEYFVRVLGCPDAMKIENLRVGVDIGDYTTRPAQVLVVAENSHDSAYRVVIHEGRNRQIRRMFEAIGHPVRYLRRERLANIHLEDLGLGRWRRLSTKEVEDLKNLAIHRGKGDR